MKLHKFDRKTFSLVNFAFLSSELNYSEWFGSQIGSLLSLSQSGRYLIGHRLTEQQRQHYKLRICLVEWGQMSVLRRMAQSTVSPMQKTVVWLAWMKTESERTELGRSFMYRTSKLESSADPCGIHIRFLAFYYRQLGSVQPVYQPWKHKSLSSAYLIISCEFVTKYLLVLKCLSKVITPLLRLVIGLNSQPTRIKTKLIAPCSRGFSRALSKLREIATNSDCFIVLFVPVVIEGGDYFGIGISITTLKPLYKKAIPWAAERGSRSKSSSL